MGEGVMVEGWRCDVCRTAQARCDACRAARAAWQRAKRKARRAAGQCIDCGAAAVEGSAQCDEHLAKNAARAARRHVRTRRVSARASKGSET